jgi:hypothetical protein
MDSPRSRLALGIAAVALAAGLCVAAVWSVRGRLPAPTAVTVAPASDPAVRAENLRLRAEIARLTAERDAAAARSRPLPEPPAVSAAPMQAPAAVPHRQAAKPAAAPQSGGFTEPQTFESVSTSN